MHRAPSSVPASPRHLLPQGGKEGLTAALAGGKGLLVGQPSPLAGEGGRRTDEGVAHNRAVEVAQRTRSFAKTLRRRQPEVEKRMWSILRDRRFQGVKFRRQVPIGRYIADFACFEARLIIELDGSQHAESERDVVRDRWLAEDGYRVLRFWNTDLTLHRNGVLEIIWHHLQSPSAPSSVSASPSHLLPQGEKEDLTAGAGE